MLTLQREAGDSKEITPAVCLRLNGKLNLLCRVQVSAIGMCVYVYIYMI